MGPAMRFIAGLSAEEEEDVRKLIELVETGEAMEMFPLSRILMPPIVFPVVLHPRFWAAYYLFDDATIEIWNLGWAWDLPPRIQT